MNRIVVVPIGILALILIWKKWTGPVKSREVLKLSCSDVRPDAPSKRPKQFSQEHHKFALT